MNIQGDYLRSLTSETSNHEGRDFGFVRVRVLPNPARELPQGDGGKNPTEVDDSNRPLFWLDVHVGKVERRRGLGKVERSFKGVGVTSEEGRRRIH